MRRRAVGVVLLLLATALIAGCGDDESSDGSSSAETEAAGAYEVELPAGWTEAGEQLTGEIDEAAAPVIDEAVGEGAAAQLETTRIFFREGEGQFRTNLNVIAEELPEGVAFDQAVEDGAQLLSENLPDGAIESGPDETTLDGEQAYAMRYSAAQAGQQLQFAAIQALHEGTVYSVTLTTGADDFEEAEAEFEQIIDSWNWS